MQSTPNVKNHNDEKVEGREVKTALTFSILILIKIYPLIAQLV